MKTKVTLSEQELRRLIRASLLEQDGDVPAEINMFSVIDEDAVIGGDAVAKALKELNEQLGGLEVGEAKYTGKQYEAFIKSAAKTLGVDPGIGNWDDINPTQSQFELVSAYYKLALILLLEREDLTVGPLAVEGSKSLEFVPYIKVPSDPYFYVSEEQATNKEVVDLIEFIRTKLFDGAIPVTYKSQAFFDKLDDITFLNAIKGAKVKSSDRDPSVGFKNFLTEKQDQKLREIAKADLASKTGPLKETWKKIYTATYENYFTIPVNIPNIWNAVVDNPADPLYTPWRETWVVCNMVNKGLALPGGAAALAAMLYSANNKGLSAQSASYRPDESKSTAMSQQPLNESRRILVTHKELRRIIAAALHEYAAIQRPTLSEGPKETAAELISKPVKWFKELFSGTEEAKAATKAAVDLLGAPGTADALEVAMKELDEASSVFSSTSIASVRKLLTEGMEQGKRILDDAAKSAPDALNNPGSVAEIIGRPCVVTFSGIASATDPVTLEVARQLANNSTLYAIAQSANDLEAMAVIGKKLYSLVQKLDVTQQQRVQELLRGAAPKSEFFKLPDAWGPLVLERASDVVPLDVAVSTWADLQKKLEGAFRSLGSSITDRSASIAREFAERPVIARRAALEGAQAKAGSRIADLLSFKYNTDQTSALSKYLGGLFVGADRWVVSFTTRLGAEALSKLFDNYPRISKAFDWLMRSNLVRSIIAKQLVSYILSAILLGVGATGIDYESHPLFFIIERLSDTNPLSASLAEILLAGLNGLVDNEPEFLDDAFATALTSDPQLISDILVGALDHLNKKIKIPSGVFPELQENVTADKAPIMNALSSIARYFNYSGEARRRFAARAQQEIDAAAAQAASASATTTQGPSQKMEALEQLRSATIDETKGNIKNSLSGQDQYTYSPPANFEVLCKDYSKNRPENSFTWTGLFTAARNTDEIKMLNILIDEELMLLPDDRVFTSIAAIEDAQAGKNVPSTTTTPAPEDIEMVKAIKRLKAAIDAAQQPQNATGAGATSEPDDTAASAP